MPKINPSSERRGVQKMGYLDALVSVGHKKQKPKELRLMFQQLPAWRFLMVWAVAMTFAAGYLIRAFA